MKITGQIVNLPALTTWVKELPTEVFERAAISALNKTVGMAKTEMSRQIRAEFNLPASVVNEGLRIQRATSSHGNMSWQAVLESPNVKGRSMNLIHFDARADRSGVSVKIKRAGGRKVVAGAFIANKGRTVFRRVPGTTMNSRSRYTGTKHAEQIVPVQTIAVSQMFNTTRINAAVVEFIESKLPDVFAHEAAFFLERHRAK